MYDLVRYSTKQQGIANHEDDTTTTTTMKLNDTDSDTANKINIRKGLYCRAPAL